MNDMTVQPTTQPKTTLIVKATKTYTPAPEGLHQAICCDVVDLGMVTGQYGTKPKVRIIWEIKELMADNRRFTVSQTYTATLHEKSKLHKLLKSWYGRPLTKHETDNGIDLEKLIDLPCQLLVTHQTNAEGKTFAAIEAIMRAEKETALWPSGCYVRIKDRDKSNSNGQSAAAPVDTPTTSREPGEDDDLGPDGQYEMYISDDATPF
jgi:hypothetical protein